MEDWKYFSRLRESKKRGIVIGIAIVTGIIALAALVCLIMKKCCKNNGCEECGCDCCNDDDEPCDKHDASDDCDENGCCYTNDKDFVN